MKLDPSIVLLGLGLLVFSQRANAAPPPKPDPDPEPEPDKPATGGGSGSGGADAPLWNRNTGPSVEEGAQEWGRWLLGKGETFGQIAPSLFGGLFGSGGGDGMGNGGAPTSTTTPPGYPTYPTSTP